MGYTTIFEGAIHVDPPLRPDEQEYLRRFSHSRRWRQKAGPYETEEPSGSAVNSWRLPGAGDYNAPALGQPGLWCQWVCSEDGQFIRWDGGEKFYAAAEWMAYLIHHFFAPHPLASALDPRFEGFGGHEFNGEILAIGENVAEDVWLLKVEANRVSVIPASWPEEVRETCFSSYPEASEALGHSHHLVYSQEIVPVKDFSEELGSEPWSIRERAVLTEATPKSEPALPRSL